jgi:hypothetical protein
VSKLDQNLSETGRIAREPAQALSQESDPRSNSERGKKEALLCLQERTAPDRQAQGATQGAQATVETAEATGVQIEHVHFVSEWRGIHGKRKEMAQKENGKAQTPQTAQKDTLAKTSEEQLGITG